MYENTGERLFEYERIFAVKQLLRPYERPCNLCYIFRTKHISHGAKTNNHILHASCLNNEGGLKAVFDCI